MTDHDDRRLREFFRDLHEAEGAPVPPFRSVARPRRDPDREGVVRPIRAGATLLRGLALAAAAGALLLAIPRWTGRPSGDDEAMVLAAAIDQWEAPTDFLLRTPGAEFFRSPPRFGGGVEAMTGEGTDLVEEEVFR